MNETPSVFASGRGIMTITSSGNGSTSWSVPLEAESAQKASVEQRDRVVRILFKSPEVRVVVVGMAKDEIWPEHKASGRSLLRVERGSIALRTTNGSTVLTVGMLAVLEPREPHDVIALEDAAFLLLVSG
jgi:quercetin dioxygenase-like cupin family protein